MAEKRQKYATEMDFQEFVRWGQEYVMDEFLTDGLKGMKRAIHMLTDQSSRNEVFGGGQPQIKKK